MKTTMLISLRVLIVLTIITGVIYPLAMTLFASFVFPARSQGSIIRIHGTAVGSELIGQHFTSPKYFHGRPSTAGYDPMMSGASNAGPTSQALRDSAAGRQRQFLNQHSMPLGGTVPAVLLFASGSGLDPDISPEAAILQIGRIARARNFDTATEFRLAELVRRSTQQPQFGFLGMPRVNVLLLNIAVDTMQHTTMPRNDRRTDPKQNVMTITGHTRSKVDQ